MVHVEGNKVKPYPVHDLLIASGETYNVLLHIEKNEPYIIFTMSNLLVIKGFMGLMITNCSYYPLMPGINVFIEYENEQDYGVFKKHSERVRCLQLKIQLRWDFRCCYRG